MILGVSLLDRHNQQYKSLLTRLNLVRPTFRPSSRKLNEIKKVKAQTMLTGSNLSIGLSFIFHTYLITFHGVSSSSLGSAAKSSKVCPSGASCLSLLECQSVLTNRNRGDFENDLCFEQGRLGVCCPSLKDECETQSPAVRSPLQVKLQDSMRLSRPVISPEDLEEAIKDANLKDEQFVSLVQKVAAESELRRKHRKARETDGISKMSREEVYQRNLGEVPGLSDPGSANEARRLLLLSQALSKKLGLTTPGQVTILKSISIIEPDKCKINITCNKYVKYRPIDGSCNNLDHPEWGKVHTPYNRVLLPRYGDSVDAPKLQGPKGNVLPLARLVSTTLIKDKPMEHHNLDTLALAFGQFLDHDLSQVVGSTLPDGGAINCCDPETNTVLPRDSLHPSCFPIEIPEDDPFYAQFSVKCLNFARTAFGLPEGCVLGPRTQINNLTPWVDGSIIYGSSQETSRSLRALNGGLLAFQYTSSGTVLPPETGNMCNNDSLCLLGGDSRVNQQPGLMATHITWLREHNRIATELGKINPDWRDEDIFEEARRIVIAEFQQVTFNEFLPLIIGSDLMKRYDLYPRRSGFNEWYDPNLSPAIIQEFASAAFRLHTLIPGSIELRDSNLTVTRVNPLTNQYYNPSIFYEEPSVYKSVINGLLGQPTCPADSIMTTAITNNLFPPGTHGQDKPWGFDLFSIDVQRGRDHGLAGYNDWREACGFKRIENFSELANSFYPESLPLVESLYSSVDDIDLVAGLNLEPRPKGLNVGPTAACIITETFRRLKYSDRFWYENSGQASSFTLDQLNSIRNVTYARIICDNNGIEMAQEMAFLQPSDLNPRVSCSELRSYSLDLNLWRNEPLGTFGVSLE